MKKLIIVESPAKARTIKNFLGREYEVVASKGHIRDLPKNSFGIKIKDDHFIPEYQIDKEHQNVVNQIKDLATKSDIIYIATDEDREGEAIGYHIASALEKEPQSLPRIVFHEITKAAIFLSLKNPRKLDMNRVNAQQARRLLDRIVGYKLSPLLSTKIQKGLSAGRVQSAALKLIVDREREIMAFVPVEYWSIDAVFALPNLQDLSSPHKGSAEASLVSYNGKKLDKMDIKTSQEADEIARRLKAQEFLVKEIETKKKRVSSPPPFMTSTLQQTASTQLGFSPKKTMMIAQTLYEGVATNQGITGLITYMRTDSLNIAQEASDKVREIIQFRFGDNYLPKKTKIYTTKAKGAQEAHEAIRPTILEFTPEIARDYLKPDELKLYTLIYNRFVASQMEDALYETQNIYFESPDSLFKASGRRLVFDGFLRILGAEDKDKLLPEFKVGQKVNLEELKANQHFTEPPARFSEASLIKTLESLGIGRPSTYAPTIAILQERGYIVVEKKQIVPTETAFKVTTLLEEHFSDIVDSGFTAKLEEELDEIAENKKDWQELLGEFYGPFIQKIEEGKKNIASQKKAMPTGRTCPLCGHELLLRSGRFGEFIACSNYPKCKYTEAIKKEPKDATPTDVLCEKCGHPMVVKEGKRGKFLACSNYPACKNTKSLSEPRTLEVACPECGGALVERQSKKGLFFGCKNYPKCTFISRYEPVERHCSKCGYLMAKREYRKKEVYECIKCKHREEADEQLD